MTNAPAIEQPATSSPGDEPAGLPALMRRLDELLATALEAAQAERGPATDAFRGMYLGGDEVARLLAPGRRDDPLTLYVPGALLRLDRLALAFGLAPVEVELLLLALAPELGLRYQRIFGYLQDDMTRRRPSVDLALDLLGAGPVEKLAAWQIFAPGAPLVEYRLVRLLDDPDDRHAPLPGRPIGLDEALAGYLLGTDDLDRELAAFAHLDMPTHTLADLVLLDDVRANLASLVAGGDEARVCIIQGPRGSGRRTVAGALCRAIGPNLALLVVDAVRVPNDDAGFEAALRLVRRESVLRGALVCWEGVDALLGDERGRQRDALLREAAGWRGPLLLCGESAWPAEDIPPGLALRRISLPRLGSAERAELWERMLGDTPRGPDVDLGEVAAAFRLGAAQIRAAVAEAQAMAEARGGPVGAADLRAASRTYSTPRLGALARRVKASYGWDDLVLPPERKALLRELCEQARHRARVHEEWGFGRRLVLGKGLVALFAGPSGTGKTMAASIIAAELGLDLYAIDLSAVVSKYIGETEKHLAAIFAEAESGSAVLLFDEADALFGKRSEVRDAHDRYANLEVAYLLQRVEAYEGIVLLSTNLRKNMDEAFVRRMRFIVDFPAPGEAERLQIWERVWPPELPRDPALDLALAARRFEVPGGTICNIVLGAAFLAAGNGGVVGMHHLLHAARREYQKIGKVVAEGDFEPAR